MEGGNVLLNPFFSGKDRFTLKGRGKSNHSKGDPSHREREQRNLKGGANSSSCVGQIWCKIKDHRKGVPHAAAEGGNLCQKSTEEAPKGNCGRKGSVSGCFNRRGNNFVGSIPWEADDYSCKNETVNKAREGGKVAGKRQSVIARDHELRKGFCQNGGGLRKSFHLKRIFFFVKKICLIGQGVGG